MNLDLVLQSEVSQKEKILFIKAYIWNPEKKNGTDAPTGRAGKEVQTLRMSLWTQRIKERAGESPSRVALTYAYSHVDNRQLAGSTCSAQGAQPGVL